MSYNTPARILQGGTFATGGTLHNVAHGIVGIPAQGSVMVYTGLSTVSNVVATPHLTGGSFGAVVGSIYASGSVQLFGANGSVFGVGPGSVAWQAYGV